MLTLPDINIDYCADLTALSRGVENKSPGKAPLFTTPIIQTPAPVTLRTLQASWGQEAARFSLTANALYEAAYTREQNGGPPREKTLGPLMALNRALVQNDALSKHAADLIDRNQAAQTAKAAAEQLARTDALTQIPNRRAAQEALEWAIEARRRGIIKSFSVLAFDLDGFKVINEQYGHPVGDDCLCEAAHKIQGLIRQTDLACRWGGDEFILILIDMDESQHAEFLQRFEDTFKKLWVQVPGRNTEINLCASAGIVAAEDDDTYETILQRADTKAGAAKNERYAGQYESEEVRRLNFRLTTRPILTHTTQELVF